VVAETEYGLFAPPTSVQGPVTWVAVWRMPSLNQRSTAVPPEMETETLLAHGWADTEEADASYVWVSMRRLRQKIEVDPDEPVHLLTVRGVGYRLVPTRAENG